MFIIDQPYTILLIASITISLSMAVSVLLHKRTLGVYAFAVLKAAIGSWAFASLFEVCSLDIQTKVFAYSFKFVFIVMVPAAWFIFGLYYSNRLRNLRFSQIALLTVVPLITLLLVSTNRYHHLMFTSLDVVKTESYLFIVRQFGNWFWVHATYSYSLLFLGFFFMAKHLIDSPAHYRWQVVTLMVGGLTPWIANMIFTFKLLPFAPYLDLTPFAFTISGLAFMVGIVRFQLLDVVPIAQAVVMEHLDDGIVVLDGENRIINLNPAAEKLCGRGAARHIGARVEEIYSWWSKTNLAEDNCCDTALPLPVVEVTTENVSRLLRLKRLALTSNDREVGRLITLHDVTDAVQAKEALRSSEERFRSLSENAPVIIFALEPKGAVSYLNPAFESILGHSRQSFLGKPFFELISRPDSDACIQIFKNLIDGKKTVAELNIHFHHRSGKKRLFNTSMAANFDSRGTITGIIGLAKDITDEHALQHQLIQSQKMEAIGTLAGGIAHDFNNLLMGIQANISLMGIDNTAESKLQDRVARIEDQIQLGAHLTRQLLDYARKGKYDLTTVDLTELVGETLTVIQRTNKAITVQSLFSDEPIYLRADKGQLEMVMLNLFVNAMDAMPDGGRLTVSTRLVNNKGQAVEEDSNAGYCELLVSDTGSGMDESVRKRIFEPFFTTKAVGRGTGLGLASVYGVVQKHGGRIEVDSIVGEGTTFSLFLPTAPMTVKAPAKPKSCALSQVHGGKILLVEDEPLIRKFCTEMIQSLNFTVLTAGNGKEAIQIYTELHSEIQLVIIDMIMPEMDGLSVYQALNRINPQLKVIVTSGYAADDRIDQILSHGSHTSLKKPYTRDELAEKIAYVLTRQSAEPCRISTEAV